MAFVKNWGLD